MGWEIGAMAVASLVSAGVTMYEGKKNRDAQNKALKQAQRQADATEQANSIEEKRLKGQEDAAKKAIDDKKKKSDSLMARLNSMLQGTNRESQFNDTGNKNYIPGLS